MYVVRCADGTLYTGISSSVASRISAHNSGKGAKYTRSRRPVFLLYTCKVGSKGDALRLEYAFKRLPRSRKIEIISQSPGFDTFKRLVLNS